MYWRLFVGYIFTCLAA
uniref:Uncharacterized protein n=1 Tax=Anguilla anguilla TaxID=7936 RepID=A0A0E9VRL3_ANGAN